MFILIKSLSLRYGNYQKNTIYFIILSYFVLCNAQNSRLCSFVLKISEDGESTLTAYLPAKPSGRAVVCMSGGGYTHLAIDNEGHN